MRAIFLAILPIDKRKKVWYNWRPGDVRLGPNFNYTLRLTKSQLTKRTNIDV